MAAEPAGANVLQAALQAARRLLFLAADPLAVLGGDYYALLGLDERADEPRIREACRALLLALDPADAPPGVGPDDRERAETLALMLAEIEECLCDPQRRKAYDAERRSKDGSATI